jgi:hypothetical protein
MDRGGDLAAALLDHLRARLDERGLELQEPLTPINGGFDTRIFAFRLRSAAPAFAGPLILRLLGPQHDPARVLRERVTQNTLAGLGYPAPRVLLACSDRAPLGGAFLVMERLPGAPLLQARYLRWLVAPARLVMVNRYLAGYRRRRPIDPRSLAYYEALSAMRALIRAAESRGREGAAAANPLDASRFAETLVAHFTAISEVTPALPPRKQ